MSDRSWRDFFESRSFYEYEIFSQKLPLRYVVNRNYRAHVPPYVPSYDSDEINQPRRRCAGFYWCCCFKALALLAVALVLMSLIGGLSYYFLNKEPSKMDNQQSNKTNVTFPGTNWTYTTSLNLFTNGTIIARETTDKPIATTTTPSQTRTINETYALTSTLEPVNVTSSVVHTTGSNFVKSEATEGDSEERGTTPSSLGNTTTFYDSTNHKTSSSGYPITLPIEDKDLSTVLAEETTLEARKDKTTTLPPWMYITSTSLSDDLPDAEEISTPEPWMNVTSSTLSDGFTDDNGSGMSEDN